MSARVSNIADRLVSPDTSGMVNAALEIAARRRAALLRLKAARVAGNVEEAFRIIDELVPDGVLNSHDKEMPGTVARIDRRTSRR